MNQEAPYILIVDDNLTNLKVTTGFLKDQGYRIGLAQSGAMALNQLDSNIPDLILLDIMMPEMDGLEVCRRIKKQMHLVAIPIIFLTAKTQTEDLVAAFQAGGVDYITKPFQKDELLARVKTHIDLSMARQRIEEMNKTRDKLYSIIAHDIKTPFSNIILMIDALQNNHIDPASQDFQEVITQLSDNTHNTLSLLKNLLTWTRFQTRMNDLQPAENNLSALVYETVYLLHPSAVNKKIAIESELPDTTLAWYDETTMHTVLRNLLSNALKFTPKGGHIQISITKQSDYQQLTIKDSGVGMSADTLRDIFDHHKPLSTPGTENEPGTGLGLMMIKDFVARNHGQIQIESQIDQGTEISILIPVKPQEQ
ncbi:MAG: hybrid sensor histidine kinase/response regulator [Marinilabiliaceae bacterium]|nr:hybrid sensor histidine kinase/response regulator [Marinilabiliaceae bacterium]